MNILKFKTNLNCSGCLSSVTPYLNGVEGIENWNVDLNNPSKTLTVESNGATEKEIVNTINKAGYKAESTQTI